MLCDATPSITSRCLPLTIMKLSTTIRVES